MSTLSTPDSLSSATAPQQTAAGFARLRSLDVLRGAVIAGMILVNGQFAREDSYRQLAHAAWDGWTVADTIFPCFLFLVGVSLAFSTTSRIARGEARATLLSHALRRTVLIFACGVFVDYVVLPVRGFPFVGVAGHLQLSGVLQKIAVCYLAAFTIYLWTGLRGVVAGVFVLNLLYLGLLYLYPIPECGAGVLTASCSFPAYLDGLVLDGLKSDLAYDPDGLGAILPAITSVLFGVLAGEFLRRESAMRHRIVGLLGGGVASIVAALVLAIWVPINKPLWTPSYAVFMAGLSAAALAGCIWLVDGSHPRLWSRPFEILGRNAITAYLLSRLLANFPKLQVAGISLHDDILGRLSAPNASLLFAMSLLVAVFVPVWLMDRRGWRLKF